MPHRPWFNRSRSIVLCAVSWLVFGCVPEGEITDAAGSGGRTGTPPALQDPAQEGDPVLSEGVCGSNAELCNGVCVSTQTNAKHCGGCNQACAAGLFCVSGSCQGTAGPSTPSTPNGPNTPSTPQADCRQGATCSVGQFCDQTNGTCRSECTADAQCAAPMACNFKTRACDVPRAKFSAISAGGSAFADSSSCGVIDGQVRCWGGNLDGKLGLGETLRRPNPAPVVALTDARRVVAGSSHTCALTAAGGVKCWGSGEFFQLGPRSPYYSSTPRQVEGLESGVTSLVASDLLTCAIQGGVAKCFGENDGTVRSLAAFGTGVRSVSIGTTHICAVTAAGGVKCAGTNEFGQLGNGTLVDSATPVDVTGLTTGVAAVHTGGDANCALLTNGGVRCWGFGAGNQLGNNSTANALTPVAPTNPLPGVVGLAMGDLNTCVWNAAGQLACWGIFGAANNGVRTSAVPGSLDPSLNAGVTAVSGDTFSTCLIQNGGLRCFGENGMGQLGDGTFVDRTPPAAVPGFATGVLSVATSRTHTCAVLQSGEVRCWGSAYAGMLGDGVRTEQLSPATPVAGLAGATAVSVGATHTCALAAGGAVRCWGFGGNNRLGDGTTVESASPVQVVGLEVGARMVSAGLNHSCAVTQAGGARCWGVNANGQLGNGTVTATATTVDVSGLTTGVASVVAGYFTSCAVTSAGGAKCWGSNSGGQLGNGTTTQSPTPIDVAALTSGVRSIGLGRGFGCALLTTGGVRCWGRNELGQLGDGSTTQRLTPVEVSGITNATSLSVGEASSCAILQTGEIRCWGNNTRGECGDGTNVNKLTPVTVVGVKGALSVSVAENHACATFAEGRARCWGNNDVGQLGDNTGAVRLAPMDVTPL